MTDESWTIESILRVTKEYFAGKGIPSARLDAELLLSHTVGLSRVQLYTQYDRPLLDSERDAFRSLVKRRGTLEPVAYILGEREFYGRVFEVNSDVLVPRPETEHLIDAVVEWARPREALSIVDVGTGSGCIAVTLACECPTVSIVATDTNPQALQVAKRNAAKHEVSERTEWHEVDLLPAEGVFDAIVSNPPYIADDDSRVEPGVQRHEPNSALYAGADGLDVIRRLISNASARLQPGGLLAFEIGADQERSVSSLLAGVRFSDDLQGRPRIALWNKPR